MSKLLIQDDIINGMDVYVEYTLCYDLADCPDDVEIILYDYGLELEAETLIRDSDGSRRVINKLQHISLRGFKETAWMPEKLEEYITAEHTVEPDYE